MVGVFSSGLEVSIKISETVVNAGGLIKSSDGVQDSLPSNDNVGVVSPVALLSLWQSEVRFLYFWSILLLGRGVHVSEHGLSDEYER